MAINYKKHILIVEDSIDLQVLLARLLAKEGYTSTRAMNGQEGLDILRSSLELPALILLDIMMPVMDGLAFRRELQKDPRLAAIPVVVMTADSHPETKAAALHAKALLRKPIDIDHLLEIAARVIA